MKYLIALILFIPLFAFSQELTTKDFKTSLDTFTSNARITKEQLFNLKQLHTNFTWAHIKSFIVYFSGVGATQDVSSAGCDGDTMCPLLNKYFERSGPGTVVSFNPIVFNNQGKQIEWNGILFVIKDSDIKTSP